MIIVDRQTVSKKARLTSKAARQFIRRECGVFRGPKRFAKPVDFGRLFKKHGVKTAPRPGLQPLSEAELETVAGGAKDPNWRPGGASKAELQVTPKTTEIPKVTQISGPNKCIGAEPYLGTRNPSLDFAGKSGVGRASLTEHLGNHGNDFGFITEAEYLQGARKFFEKPLTPTTEAFTSDYGWYFRYDRATNEFGIINNRGGISTYYKPDEGYVYWIKECVEKYAPK